MAEKNSVASTPSMQPPISKPVILQESSTTMRMVPVPWYPPVRTSRLRPGSIPAQTEMNLGSANCSK